MQIKYAVLYVIERMRKNKQHK